MNHGVFTSVSVQPLVEGAFIWNANIHQLSNPCKYWTRIDFNIPGCVVELYKLLSHQPTIVFSTVFSCSFPLQYCFVYTSSWKRQPLRARDHTPWRYGSYSTLPLSGVIGCCTMTDRYRKPAIGAQKWMHSAHVSRRQAQEISPAQGSFFTLATSCQLTQGRDWNSRVREGKLRRPYRKVC